MSKRTSAHAQPGLVALVALCIAAVSTARAADDSPRSSNVALLRDADDFSTIVDTTTRSLALYAEATKVLLSPRCLNCHPVGDRPTQGERMTLHQPLVLRGDDGFGHAALRCQSCHQPANFDPGPVPGHPGWHLAPRSMAWQGKSAGAVCEQLKDPQRNGGRRLEAIVDHMANDSLVGWAWRPDVGRAPAVGTQARFGRLVQAWAETGAYCPPP